MTGVSPKASRPHPAPHPRPAQAGGPPRHRPPMTVPGAPRTLDPLANTSHRPPRRPAQALSRSRGTAALSRPSRRTPARRRAECPGASPCSPPHTSRCAPTPRSAGLTPAAGTPRSPRTRKAGAPRARPRPASPRTTRSRPRYRRTSPRGSRRYRGATLAPACCRAYRGRAAPWTAPGRRQWGSCAPRRIRGPGTVRAARRAGRPHQCRESHRYSSDGRRTHAEAVRAL